MPDDLINCHGPRLAHAKIICKFFLTMPKNFAIFAETTEKGNSMLKRLYRSIWGTFKHKHKWNRSNKDRIKACRRCGATSVVKQRKGKQNES